MIESAERPPEAVSNDLIRMLHQSEHRVNLLARAVLELASEVLGVELKYDPEPDEPRSTQALLLAHEALEFWRS